MTASAEGIILRRASKSSIAIQHR